MFFKSWKIRFRVNVATSVWNGTWLFSIFCVSWLSGFGNGLHGLSGSLCLALFIGTGLMGFISQSLLNMDLEIHGKNAVGKKWGHLIVMLIRRDTCTTKSEMFLLDTIICYRLESWIWSNFEVTFINTDPDGSMFYCHHFPFNVFFCWFTFPSSFCVHMKYVICHFG